jgi:hypothetical protein
LLFSSRRVSRERRAVLRTRRWAARLAAFTMLAAAGAAAAPPTPFVVNEYATGTQIQPAVCALSDGSFAVTWTSAFQDGFGLGVFGRVFDADAGASTSEFQINAFTTCYQFAPAVDVAGDGFVVTWQSGPAFSPCTQDGSGFGVFARVFDGTGTALTDELQVNTFTTYGQANPAVADVGDGFVVVWDSDLEDGDGTGVFARLFATNGTAAGTEFQVAETTLGDQYRPAVAALGDGGFHVVWLDSQGAGAVADVFGRRFGASGEALTSEALLSAPSPVLERARPLIVPSGDGATALWSARDAETRFDVVGVRINESGAVMGGELVANAYVTARQTLSSVVASGDGFIVAWNSLDQDGDSEGVFARRMGADARPIGPEFPVSAYTLGEQSDVAVAALTDGGFVAAWSSPEDASEYAVVAARFPAEHALAECGDADASGTITARDALLALRAATEIDTCTLGVCDVDGDGESTTTDALRILRAAVGLPAELDCPV